MTPPVTHPGLAMAREIEPQVLAGAEQAEQNRTLPQSTVDALWQSGLMQWMNPAVASGQEPTLIEMIETWEEMARQDGSVGWIGIANLPSAAFAAAYLPDEGFEEVFLANDCRVTLAGQFAPVGLGEVAEGGYRLTGEWSFGSGSGHSEYVVGGFIPMRDGEMEMMTDVLPQMLVAVLPREQITFTDNWHVTGLKGTGSFDYHVHDVFVPERRVYPLFTRAPQRGGVLYTMGVMPVVAAGHAAWALGVARGALDDIVELAREKTRMGDETTLAHKLTFQRDLAHHEAMWRAARAGLITLYEGVGRAVEGGAEVTAVMRADMRMSATYATEAAKEIVRFAHLAAGTTAIREGSRLERSFRDLYTGSQHAFINEKTYTDSAQLMLGLIDDSPFL